MEHHVVYYVQAPEVLVYIVIYYFVQRAILFFSWLIFS